MIKDTLKTIAARQAPEPLSSVMEDASRCAEQALALWQSGQWEAGHSLLDRYCDAHPEDAMMASMPLFFAQYVPKMDAQTLYEKHRSWARRFAPTHLARTTHGNVVDPERRLRIGYVSPDFYTHVVSYSFEPFLKGHNRDRFEVFGYGSVRQPDQTTARFQKQFDHYRDVFALSDAELAQQVEADGIDIFISVAGHVAGHRLGALAYRPAPVQCDILGINTTGIFQIDYRLTDACYDPPGHRIPYTETSIVLPRCLVCFAPHPESPTVGPLPYERNGFITFGSFNAGLKVNRELIGLWAQILHQVPSARLLLKLNSSDEQVFKRYRQWFEAVGIGSDRLEIIGYLPADADHLALHNRVDLALDSYPFNGSITTLDGLWMGVPPVSMCGDRFVSRVSLSLLTALGLEGFVADCPERYVAKAVALAQQPEALAKIRAGLRSNMAQSDLCDARAYTEAIEAAYRRMWRRWCEEQGGGNAVVGGVNWAQVARQAERAFRVGDLSQAIGAYETALQQGERPSLALQTLSDLYLLARDFGAARPCLEELWQQEPQRDRLDRLVLCYTAQGDLVQAYEVVATALANQQVSDLQDTQLARTLYRVWPQGHGSTPDPQADPVTWAQDLLILAQWLFQNERHEAAAVYQHLLRYQAHGLAHARLGHIARFAERLDVALDHMQQAVDLEPENATYRAALANLLFLVGDSERGLEHLRAARDLDPNNAEIHSSYLFALHYVPDQDAQHLFEEHQRWGKQHGPVSLMMAPAPVDRDPQRRLRIGFLCADFKQHSVGYTFAGLLAERSPADVEVFVYGSVAQPDFVTEQIKAQCDVYHDVCRLDDPTVAALIRHDQIDILVAVAGHSYGHRLRVLAYKPAPIQVDYGGINTTGLSQVDYRLTDAQQDPPSLQKYFLETLIYLPEGRTSYRPPALAPEVNPLPALRNGVVTFGACHAAQKITPAQVQLWAQVLTAVPQSRLRLKCPGAKSVQLNNRLWTWFAGVGLKKDHVTIEDSWPAGCHLHFYHEVDVMLDTYPFNGCVTTLEGLWMGVPPVTQAGSSTVSRAGLGLLAQLDMTRLVAHSPEDYVKTAMALCADLEVLARIRKALRGCMRASSLCDTTRFAKQLEQAYREMWQRYCDRVEGDAGHE